MTRNTFLKHLLAIWSPRLESLGFESVETENGENFPLAGRFQKATEDRLSDVQLEFRNKTDFARVIGTLRFPRLQSNKESYLPFFTKVGRFYSFSKLKIDQLDVIEPLLWDDIEDTVLPMFQSFGDWKEFDKLEPDDIDSLVVPKNKFRIGHRSEHALFMARMHLQRGNYELALGFASKGLAIEGMETTRNFDPEFREIVSFSTSKMEEKKSS